MLHDIDDYYADDSFCGIDQKTADDFRSYLKMVLKIREDSHERDDAVGRR